MVETIAASLGARLDAYFVAGDPRPLLEADAVADAERLCELTVRDDVLPVDVGELVAWVHWGRHLARVSAGADAGDDRIRALNLFAMMVPDHREALPAPLQAALYGEPTDASADDLADLGTLIIDNKIWGAASEAVTLLQRAIERSDPGSVRWAEHHTELVRALDMRFESYYDPDDLDAAVAAARVASAADPSPGHDFNLGRALATRFAENDDIADLDSSIAAFRAAVNAAGPDSSERLELQGELAIGLRRRFARLDRTEDLDEAIRIGRMFTDAGWLSQLGGWLMDRFERFERMADLDEAIEAVRTAVDDTGDDDPELSGRLANAASALLLRFERFGDRADIDDAVRRLRAAVAASPDWEEVVRGVMTVLGDGPEAAMTSLSGLCNALRTRYEQVGELADLDEAIVLGRGLFDATPHTDADRVIRGTNLALNLYARFSVSGDPADIEVAAQMLRDALAVVTADNPVRLKIENMLVVVLRDRFETLGEPADLDEAVTIAERGLAVVDRHHPLRPALLVNLSLALQRRLEHTGDPTDLDGAIAAARATIVLLPDDHPRQTLACGVLGDALHSRFEAYGDLAALHEARALWRTVAACTTISSGERLNATRACATAAAVTGDWPGVMQASAVGVHLLNLGAWHGLGRASRERHLRLGAGAAVDAAAGAVAAGDPLRGVALLEQGRGVLWAGALDMRVDLAELTAREPQLAAKLETARTALERPV